MGLRACPNNPPLSQRPSVSIYPKAEMGLRVQSNLDFKISARGFNLPEGRDGFKRQKKTQ